MAEKEDFSYEKISDPYYFESDHVALKENSDYRHLLHTIALLEAQRKQTAQDIETLYRSQDEALADPLHFVERLQKGENFGYPLPQKIAELPVVAWEKYTSTANFSYFASSKHKTRNKKGQLESGSVDQVQSLKSKLLQGVVPQAAAAAASPSTSSNSSDLVVVRGRAKDSSKPATFNQLWTEEEQQRLESLLVQFPPEEVESRRWAKIADALGNRTPIQVASRVQKYFLRLAREGLPVPGRMPNLTSHSKKGSHRHHRYSRMYYSSSTFLQSHVPPVWMPDDGTDMETGSGRVVYNGDEFPSFEMSKSTNDSSDEDDYPEDIVNSPEFQELQQLRRLRKDKLQREQAALTRHVGYKCDNCGCEPIVGIRWHCIDCPADVSYDFCDDCSIVPFQHEKHDSSHRLQPYKRDVLDSDYMSFTKSNYNYLDSNYMPAS
ncbi:ZZ-type zinc finger-containing protein 3 [Aplysia californica]|uniref:ZZ-type zinc finger-containing protein 3 n=1 Tax=Aplysia californica TaxID=6500 RepID=A0ABM1A3H0_APLCA|nr:ZZ-type zinc finger-containing protein 3 [Aplysia californica]XP_012940055.1 ZZ-type zinc finger-containing protein 3 [Aplysia californica]XP_012940059.1 ZZ-type zinc finger-containing protein 3 [Aplysia californica]XP_012940060.1 ZZ-type zinc finger-containing protein 3 [Aplysia californica]XP_012940069.1 ZZ-type zinc finger-containing protein 3 [Aplysia californica]